MKKKIVVIKNSSPSGLTSSISFTVDEEVYNTTRLALEDLSIANKAQDKDNREDDCGIDIETKDKEKAKPSY
jgi:hypothetical protein